MHNNPRLLFKLYMALAVIGALAAVIGLFTMPRASSPNTTLLQRLPLFGGLILLCVGGVMASLTWFKLNVREKLERGENLLGQWRVGQGDLARFREADAARAALTPTLRNWLSFPEHVPATGLPVAISLEGMLIGDVLHGIGTNNGAPQIGMLCEAELIEGNPAMLELTHGKTAMDDYRYDPIFDMNDRRPLWVMRVPVPAEARGQAERAVAALDGAIWTINRDWARRSYATHFHIADRDAAGRASALAGAPRPPEPARVPEPAAEDRSPEARAFRAIADVFGMDAAKAPTNDAPAHRKAQAQFFGGVMGLGILFGGGPMFRYHRNFEAAVMIVWGVLFLVAMWFTLRGGYHYLVKKGA